MLTVCGDFEPDRALESIERWFGEIPAGPPVPPIPGTTELPPARRAGPRGRQPGRLAPRIYLAFRIPPYGDDDFYPAESRPRSGARKGPILSGASSASGRSPRTSSAFAFPIVTGAAMLVVIATARPGPRRTPSSRAPRGHRLLRDVAPEDVERAVNLIEARRLIELQQVGERADMLSMYTTLFDDPGRINTELDSIRAVTPERARLRRRFFGDDNRGTLLYVPTNGEKGGEG